MKVDGTKLLEEFRRHLAEHNLPATHQRLAVAEAVLFAGEHLSAEEVGLSPADVLAQVMAAAADRSGETEPPVELAPGSWYEG